MTTAKTTTKEDATVPEKNIIQLISLISEEAGALAPTAKTGVPFPFRGIDGTINHLSPFLRKYGVVYVPTVETITVTPREVGNRVVKTTELTTRFDFYAPDGSSVSATTAGLADDFGDRSTAQAQSVALRVALLQTFSLPTQTAEPEQTGAEVENGREPAAETAASKLRAQIEAYIADDNNPYTGPMVNELANSLTKKDPSVWMSNASDLKKIWAALEAGVTA